MVVTRDRKVVIVNKNSNQSQTLKLVGLHVLGYFFFMYLRELANAS